MPKSHHHSHRSKSSSGPSRSSPSSRSASTARTAQSGSAAGDNNATMPSTKERVQDIHSRTTRKDQEEHELKRKLVPRLAKRAYHLEDGNSWFQDWAQYQKNTHPVFGICMHHRLHPIRFPQRIIILVGSIAFGFAITNVVYLGYLGNEDAGGVVNAVYDVTGKVADIQQKYTSIELEQSVVFLLTVGSFIHSMFDMMIWYLMACFCFRPGGIKTNKLCQTFGIYAAVLVVILAVAAATTAAVVRLNEDSERAEVEYEASLAEQFADQQLGDSDAGDNSQSSSKWSFLVGYFLELVFALFVFYFITSTVFFSGILGCGRVPVLGGRPYELRKAAAKSNSSDGEQSEDEESAVGLQGYDI